MISKKLHKASINLNKTKFNQTFSKVKVTLNVFEPIALISDEDYNFKMMHQLTEACYKLLDEFVFLQPHFPLIEPSQIGYLVQQTGLSRSYINRLIRKLCKLGLIHKVNNGYKRRCTYYLNAIFLDPDFRERFACFLPALRFPVKAHLELNDTLTLLDEEEIQIISLRKMICELDQPLENSFDDYGPRGNSPQPFPHSVFDKKQSSGDPGAVKAQPFLIVGRRKQILTEISHYKEDQMRLQYEFSSVLIRKGII